VTETNRRPYDATKRRQRAEEERRATRRRVIAAAQRLFVAKGYTDTTMGDIAKTAGVALQSVYKAASSKAELLQLVVDAVVAGDDEDVMMSERPSFAAIAEDTNPERQVRKLAALIASIQERSAPVQSVFRQAAAVDDTIAANLDCELQRRHESFAVLLGTIPEDRLRHSRAESTDTAWAIGSSEVYQLLRIRRAWDADHYREWLSRTLVEQLLSPSPAALD
jgi:AcrR family transcriptional regulator